MEKSKEKKKKKQLVNVFANICKMITKAPGIKICYCVYAHAALNPS